MGARLYRIGRVWQTRLSPAITRERIARRKPGRHGPEPNSWERHVARSFLGRILNRLVSLLASWHRRRRDRRLVASLDDRALRDLGIDRSMVDNDSILPFWRQR
jgi:uncharacterized protein YjiS (DUF1127 family)